MKRKTVRSRALSEFPISHAAAVQRKRNARLPGQRKLLFEQCELRTLLSADGLASISGAKFDDLTGDGFTPDDAPLGGVEIQLFLDDGDGVFDDALDTLADSQVTDAVTGQYAFNDVANGVYFIREVPGAGMTQTAGPAFYTVLVSGDCVFPLDGTMIDDFEAPVPADAFFISAIDPDPTLFEHTAAEGILGGERDALIDVLGTPNPLSANIVVGFDGTLGVFAFGSAVPGTTATLQYDGLDMDDPGPPAALVDSFGLSADLTDGGMSTGILFDFLGVDPGQGADLEFMIRATSPGGGTATLTTMAPASLVQFVQFVSFTDFTTAGGFSFTNVDSLEIQFNSVGIADVDFEVDLITATDMRSDGYDFGNFRDISIHGMKFNDLDGDGTKDDGEPGLSGWMIELFDAQGNVIDQTTTDDAGNYWFTDLPLGTYSVQEVQQAGWTQTFGLAGYTVVAGMDVQSGGQSLNNDFGNFQDISIHGMKFNDLDGDGSKDDGEPGLPGWVIELSDEQGNVIDQTTTDDAGNYWFTDLPLGTYSVQEVQQTGWTQTFGLAGYTVVAGMDVQSGGQSLNNDFGNQRMLGSIHGTKWEDTNGDGVRQAGEPGLPGVTIYLDLNDNGVLDAGEPSEITNDTGAYWFTELEPGVYTVRESVPDGFTQTFPTGPGFSHTVLIGDATQSSTLVTIRTPLGDIPIELFDQATPTTVANFLNYVNDGDYINSLVHRSASLAGGEPFVIQGGGFAFDGANVTQVPTDPPVMNEPGISNTRGTIAMAKSGGNPNSATSQWFINMRDNSGEPAFLDSQNGGFTVFGRVIGDGMSVVDAIAALPVENLSAFVDPLFAGALTETPVIGFNGPPLTASELVLVSDVVVAGLRVENVDFGNFRDISIHGMKFNDLDGDGVKDDGEPGLPGWVIELSDAQGNVIDQMTTDDAGNYWFMGLPPGTYSVQEVQQAGWTQTFGLAGYTIVTGQDVQSGGASEANDFGNFRDISIHGMKFNDLDGDGVKEDGEPGLPGWVIELSDAQGNVIDQTTTDDAGNYWFTDLPLGTYSVQEVQQAGWTQTFGIAGYTVVAGMDVQSGGQSLNNDFGNFQDISIHGMKFNDLDGDGVKEDGEPGLPGWVIELSDAQGNVIDQTTTDDAGNYWFTDLPLGTYSVQEVQQAGWTQTFGLAGYTVVAGVDVQSGGRAEGNDFGNMQEEEEPSSLSGFVYNDKDNDGVFDATESGIANVVVTLMGVDSTGAMVNLMTTTDAAGRYEFLDLLPGVYEIKESQPAGFLDGKDTIGTPGGDVVNDRFFNIMLAAGFDGMNNNFGELQPASLSGFVYIDVNNNGIKDAPELGIGNVTVTLTGTDDRGDMVNMAVLTNNVGGYIFSNLRPGIYELTETQPAGFIDGKDTIGTQGGLTANDMFFQIVLHPCVDGVNNNFGERGLDPTVTSKDLLLASTPQPPDLGNLGVTVGRGGNVGNLTIDPAMETWVGNLYQDVLGRGGSTAEVQYWARRIASGTPYTTVTDTFVNGVERRTGFINQLYFDYLGRGVDPVGLNSWLRVWQQTGGPEEIQAGIIGSPEYYQFAGGTDGSWVDALYGNILGRGAAQHEIDYWVDKLDDVSTREVVLGFVLSREYRKDMIRDWYSDYLHRQAEETGVDFWVNRMQQGESEGDIQAGLLASAEYRNLP